MTPLHAAPAAHRQPIIFIGPSMPLELATEVLADGDFRPPVRRGDLEAIAAPALVGIIDGVFAETLAISPGEIRDAIDRGITVYGAASVGALRAAEIPAMIGVGRVFQMYRDGAIERDDEVALLFDPETYRNLTTPLVNVRYAVERLVRSGTLPRATGYDVVAAASKLHFRDRTYTEIVRSSTLSGTVDADETVALLKSFDLKREDAQLLLETVAAMRTLPADGSWPTAMVVADRPETHGLRALDREPADGGVVVWESGDAVSFPELVDFLKVTGTFNNAARRAIARVDAGGGPPWLGPDALATRADPGDEAQALLDFVRLQWGWESPEEAHATMRDLGLGLDDVSDALHDEVIVARLVAAVGRYPTERLQKALRAELWMNELALKREVIRLGALRHFAALAAGAGPPSEIERDGARRCIARIRATMQWSSVESDLATIGTSRQTLDAFVDELALARRAGAPVVAALDRPPTAAVPCRRRSDWIGLGLALEPSSKAEGSRRFALGADEAFATAEQIARQMGVVRVGLVGELTTLGVHIAQTFADRRGWSSSFASGKAETVDGAKAGSIMEEAEIQAQDAFVPAVATRRSFRAAVAAELPVVDPDDLGLPFDSSYHPERELDWIECLDLVASRPALVPIEALVSERVPNDLFYSRRLGGKIFSSSGLGSGFTLAEAAVHAASELIERHAVRLAELELDNPGRVGVRSFFFVDLDSLPATPRRIVDKYGAGGMTTRILDITSEIAVPTFYARVFEDPFGDAASTASDGFAAHPDPEVAVTMALLEAAQTKAGFIAGGREDYSLQARSLGRHERPRTIVPHAQAFWFGNDRPVRPLHATTGFVTRDLIEELEWIVAQVEHAGYPSLLLADLSCERIAPARAVRMALPGSETTNPLHTGRRGRATCIRDLLPRGAP